MPNDRGEDDTITPLESNEDLNTMKSLLDASKQLTYAIRLNKQVIPK